MVNDINRSSTTRAIEAIKTGLSNVSSTLQRVVNKIQSTCLSILGFKGWNPKKYAPVISTSRKNIEPSNQNPNASKLEVKQEQFHLTAIHAKSIERSMLASKIETSPENKNVLLNLVKDVRVLITKYQFFSDHILDAEIPQAIRLAEKWSEQLTDMKGLGDEDQISVENIKTELTSLIKKGNLTIKEREELKKL